MADTYAELPDEVFLAPPFRLAADVVAALPPGPASGLHLAAPKTLAAPTLPVAVAHAGPRRDARLLRLAERAVVVAVDLERGVAHVEQPGASGHRLPLPPSLDGAGGRDPALDGDVAEAAVFELRGPSGRGWEEGWYALTAIAADLVSARRFVLVRGDRRPGRDDAPELTPLPPAAATPDVAAATGVAVECDAVVTLGEGAPCVLRGTARVASRYARPHAAGAAVPVTLVVVPARGAAPVVRSFAAPCDEASAPDTVTARFAVDLLALPELVEPGTFFAYAFAGDAGAGPCAVAVLPADPAVTARGAPGAP